MRILYGVVGEGMGHATRSRVVIEHLVSQGHEVEVVVSGRAHDYLKARERDRLGVNRIWGLTIVYEDNEVRNFRTVLSNLRGAVTGGLPRNVLSYFQVAEEFRPQVVVTDFETWSWLFGTTRRIPVVSLDNIQIVSRCAHPASVLEGHENDFRLAKAVVKGKVPGCYHYLVTSFFFPPVRKKRTTVHPPVLRPEILAARPERGDHVVVYQTSTSNVDLPRLLRSSGREFRVYGFRRDLREDLVDGRVVYRPFSERGFVEDLRTARAVLANGGFTLLSESVYLHKPVLASPVKKQFEQVLNARHLALLGYGLHAETVDERRLGEFLERLPDFDAKLAGYSQDGNREILATLEDVLRRAASGQDPADAGG